MHNWKQEQKLPLGRFPWSKAVDLEHGLGYCGFREERMSPESKESNIVKGRYGRCSIGLGCGLTIKLWHLVTIRKDAPVEAEKIKATNTNLSLN
jgi:hypothetical protein